MKQQVAILTMDSLEGFFAYDDLLIAPFQAHGIDVSMVSWRDTTHDWNRYDAVIIRSPWDYQDDCEQFLEVLATIEASTARLFNSRAIVAWNADKRYLRDLEQQNVQLIPTLWGCGNVASDLVQAQQRWPQQELIIKPCVSANADDTFRLPATTIAAKQLSELAQCFGAHRHYMVQPFVRSIVEHGEYSLFYFADQFSHCIQKCPAAGDFRVQEEHGGRFFATQPPAAVEALASKALAAVQETLLYARIDIALLDDGTPALMEMELIEPSLYFGVDDQSPERFVQAYLSLINTVAE
ncbi:ATP-grasp domain-containing protein [Pseudidiomarina sediminum]|uniref:ATP-grasp domain-containing protein n=1 Tax=Pseudidiomarina sediminum TaxID=431675 RepID=UPI001C9793AE|nr:hypothetical protein [Pseudidiomarina sediminum]MBY6062910.1 hypothetical protein [Pseudidiomarina sediminum]